MADKLKECRPLKNFDRSKRRAAQTFSPLKPEKPTEAWQSVPVSEAEPEDPLIQKAVYFEPGKLGMAYEKNSGLIREIYDGQARHKGVQTGWKLFEVDGRPFHNDILHEMLMGKRVFEVVFFTRRERSIQAAASP